MSNPDAYIREIDSVDKELKRMNIKIKQLRAQKKAKQELLYKYMVKNKIEKYKNKTISSVRPKECTHRKTEAQKKEESIKIFRDAGIENPEEFYLEYKEKLKNKPDKERTIESFIQKKKKESAYDPFLGF